MPGCGGPRTVGTVTKPAHRYCSIEFFQRSLVIRTRPPRHVPPVSRLSACTCRTCQLRLGTRLTFVLSPSVCLSPATLSGLVVRGFRHGGSPTGSLGLLFGGSPAGSLGPLCHAAGALSTVRRSPLRSPVPRLPRGLPAACLLDSGPGCRRHPNPAGCSLRHLLHFSHAARLHPPL